MTSSLNVVRSTDWVPNSLQNAQAILMMPKKGGAKADVPLDNVPLKDGWTKEDIDFKRKGATHTHTKKTQRYHDEKKYRIIYTSIVWRT